MKDDAAELDKIMTDMSALSEAHDAPVCDAARALLDNACRGSNSGLDEYQSATCHVYIVRVESTNYYRSTSYHIQQASGHVSTLEAAFEPLLSLGIQKHPQLEEHSPNIGDLHR